MSKMSEAAKELVDKWEKEGTLKRQPPMQTYKANETIRYLQKAAHLIGESLSPLASSGDRVDVYAVLAMTVLRIYSMAETSGYPLHGIEDIFIERMIQNDRKNPSYDSHGNVDVEKVDANNRNVRKAMEDWLKLQDSVNSLPVVEEKGNADPS